MVSNRTVRGAIQAACEELEPSLGREVTTGLATPSYLGGIALSRYVFWRKLHHIIRAAKLVPNSQVFDFGCGTGILLPHLAANGRAVWATDLHPEIAQNVVRRLDLSGVRFLPADDWQEALPDGGIETIIAANVLEHIDDRIELIKIFRRKLTPTGLLVVSGPTENRLYRFGRRLIGFSGHYHVTTIRHILDDVAAAGMQRVGLRRWPAPGPMCLYQIAALGSPGSSRP